MSLTKIQVRTSCLKWTHPPRGLRVGKNLSQRVQLQRHQTHLGQKCPTGWPKDCCYSSQNSRCRHQNRVVCCWISILRRSLLDQQRFEEGCSRPNLWGSPPILWCCPERNCSTLFGPGKEAFQCFILLKAISVHFFFNV